MIVENVEKEEKVFDDKNVKDGVKVEVYSLGIDYCSINLGADLVQMYIIMKLNTYYIY